MNIFVTGAAGFLGQRLVPALRTARHTVCGLDKEQGSDLCHDLTTPYDYRGEDLNLIIHLASEVGGFLHNEENRDQVDYELKLLENVKFLAAQARCSRIIYLSSINVLEGTQPFAHEALAQMPTGSPYAQAKAAGELFVAQNFSQFVVIRPTNFFGQGQKSSAEVGRNHVIPDLLRKIEQDHQVTVLGNGQQRRNFIHVIDVISFIIRCLELPKRGYFNLRSEIELSIGELTQQLLSFKKIEKEVVYRPEFLRYEKKAIERFDLAPLYALGWQPSVGEIAEGLRHKV